MTTTPSDTPAAPVPPLDLAKVWAARVSEIARHYEQRDTAEPGMGAVEAAIHGAGKAQYEAAQMAAYMATVSIAEDIRRIADDLHHAARDLHILLLAPPGRDRA